MNHLEKAAAAQYLALSQQGMVKEAWDNNAWYSWVPFVGSGGNLINSLRQGNWMNALGDAGMLALDIGTGGRGGMAAKGVLKGGAKLGAKYLAGQAAKGVQKGTGAVGRAAQAVRGARKAQVGAVRKWDNSYLGKRIGMKSLRKTKPALALAGASTAAQCWDQEQESKAGVIKTNFPQAGIQETSNQDP